MKSHTGKTKSKMRLNLRMRETIAPSKAKHRINLRAIRTIEEFSYDRLEKIAPESQPAELESNIIVQSQAHDVNNFTEDTWPISSLDDIRELHDHASEKAILSWIIGQLKASPIAKVLVNEVAKLEWKIALDDLGGHDFHLDVTCKTLYLHNHSLHAPAIARSSYFTNAILVGMIRGLRDIWQEKRHGGFEQHYGPEDILLLERVRAADLDVLTIMTAWELRFNGYPEAWRHILASTTGDMALAYAHTLEKEMIGGIAKNAPMTAFRQWFNNAERINASDHEALDYIDNLVYSSNGHNPFGKRKPTTIGVEILSCLPDKTAYLKGWGDDILHDPDYVGLSDPINQAHLMQVLSDIHVTYAGGVAFRDSKLAQKLFPHSEDTIH